MWPRESRHLNLAASAVGMDLKKYENGNRILAQALSRAYGGFPTNSLVAITHRWTGAEAAMSVSHAYRRQHASQRMDQGAARTAENRL